MDEDDVATYAIKTIDDPRTLNKTVYLRPPENILTQRQLIEKWEKLIGKQLEKSSINEQDFLASMKGNSTPGRESTKLFVVILLFQQKMTSVNSRFGLCITSGSGAFLPSFL